MCTVLRRCGVTCSQNTAVYFSRCLIYRVDIFRSLLHTLQCPSKRTGRITLTLILLLLVLNFGASRGGVPKQAGIMRILYVAVRGQTEGWRMTATRFDATSRVYRWYSGGAESVFFLQSCPKSLRIYSGLKHEWTVNPIFQRDSIP